MQRFSSRGSRVLAVVLFMFAIVLWWWLVRRRMQLAKTALPDPILVYDWNPSGPDEPAGSLAQEPAASAASVTPETAATPDDLTVIDGIGPKIWALLQTAGIRTFSQLARADPDRLRQILQQEGLRMADPSTWPEQAQLAAQGDWAAFKALIVRLKASRRHKAQTSSQDSGDTAG